MKELTTEQHLSNLKFAIKKAAMSFEEFETVQASFNYLVKVLTEPKEKNEQGI